MKTGGGRSKSLVKPLFMRDEYAVFALKAFVGKFFGFKIIR